MAILTAPATAAFDNLSPSTGLVSARSATSVTVAYSPLDTKLAYGLKINGQFDAQGRATAIDDTTVTTPDGQSVQIAFPLGLSTLDIDLATSPVRVDRLLEQLFRDDDIINLGDVADALRAGAGNDVVNAGGGNDRIAGGAGDDALNGGAGIDTAVYDGPMSSYARQSANGRWTVSDASGAEGSDTLTAVERLAFGDIGLALDLNGAAGTVARILGAVFGAAAVHNRAYAGIGLAKLDQGTSYEALCALAVDAAGARQPAEVVDLLWTHVVGSRPTTAQAQPFIDMLGHGTSVGQLAMLAADHELNLLNIDLVGLAKTGLEFS